MNIDRDLCVRQATRWLRFYLVLTKLTDFSIINVEFHMSAILLLLTVGN